MEKKTGIDFEKKVYEIQKRLGPDAKIKHDDRIRGIHSGQLRQVDITIRQQVAQFSLLVAIECKDHKDKVGLESVEAFAQKLRDIAANKGIIVSSSGFTKGAKKRAGSIGIETYRLLDNEVLDTAASIPMFIVRRHSPSFRARLESPDAAAQQQLKRLSPNFVMVCDSKGKPIDLVQNILVNAWNEKADTEGKEQGHIHVALGAYFQWAGTVFPLSMEAFVEVSHTGYLFWRDVRVTGLMDEQRQKLTPVEHIWGPIEFSQIFSGEDTSVVVVEDPSELAINPGLVLHVTDKMPMIAGPP